MYRTNMAVAGLNICVEHLYEGFREFAKDFVTDENNTDFVISVSKDDVENERYLVEQQKKRDGQSFAYTDRMLEETTVYRKIADKLAGYNAIVFHGSAVAVGEQAVLFTAKSGVGKTTHTKLWLKNIEGSYVVDGDKPILRIMKDDIYVCGTPWCGKERMGTNKNVLLKAICKVNRSLDNRIEKVKPSDFIPVLLEQVHCPNQEKAMLEILPIIGHIAKHISFYNLYCNMDDCAALLSFGEMML